MENLKNLFKEGSKNYEAALLLLENKSYDEVKKIISDIAQKALYKVRGKLKRKGFLGKKKDVTDSPKAPDEASQENRLKILSQFSRYIQLEKPNEQSGEEIEAMAEELGVKTEDLEKLIEEKMKVQIAKDGVKVTPEEQEKPDSPSRLLKTVPITLSGSKLKIPIVAIQKNQFQPSRHPFRRRLKG